MVFTHDNSKKTPSHYNTVNKTSAFKDKSYSHTTRYKKGGVTSGNINSKIKNDTNYYNSDIKHMQSATNTGFVCSHFCVELLARENNNVTQLLQTIHDQENKINNLRNNILHLEEKLKLLEKEPLAKNNFPIKGIIPRDNLYMTDRMSNISIKNYKNKNSLFLNETYDNEQQYSNNNTQDIFQIETNDNYIDNNNLIRREHCQTHRNNDTTNFLNGDSLSGQRVKTEPIQEAINSKGTLTLQQKPITKEQPLKLPFKLHFNYADYIGGKPFTTLISTEKSN